MTISGSYPTLPNLPKSMAGVLARQQKSNLPQSQQILETLPDQASLRRPVRVSRVAEFEALFAYDSQANLATSGNVRQPQIDEYV